MRKNEELKKKISKLRQKGRTYWEISRILGISPQLAHYHEKSLSTGIENILDKEKGKD